MSSFLDFVQADANPLFPPVQKYEKPDLNGAESGIESASSSSSLDEPAKAKSEKLVVTTATRLKPQSSSRGLPLTDRPSSAVEIAVLFRGRMPIEISVALERNARVRSMKQYAKGLQHVSKCEFALMQIDDKHIKLYSMDQPRILLCEIDCNNLDLVKQSRKDTSFFYFTAYMPIRGPEKEVDGNSNRYECFVFHGTSPKMADRAHRIIKHFCDIKASTNFYNLATLPPASPMFSDPFIPQEKSPNEIVQQKPSIPVQEVVVTPPLPIMPPSAPVADLLLNIDDFSDGTSVVSMFDTLAPSSFPQPQTDTKPKDFNLFGDLMGPPVAVKEVANPFVSQHLNYSMQMNNNLLNPVAAPGQLGNSANPFLVNGAAPTNLAPSFMPNIHPQQSFLPPTMAPVAVPNSALAPPIKPVRNPFAPMPGLPQPSNCAPMNPFTGPSNTNAASSVSYPQYHLVGGSANPFKESQPKPSRNSFGSEFDTFLSQTVKGHFTNP